MKLIYLHFQFDNISKTFIFLYLIYSLINFIFCSKNSVFKSICIRLLNEWIDFECVSCFSTVVNMKECLLHLRIGTERHVSGKMIFVLQYWPAYAVCFICHLYLRKHSVPSPQRQRTTIRDHFAGYRSFRFRWVHV